ncbi:MAG TPA: adenylate/guanylate cyclase domain-containing protein, partial [Bdellovibrionota bacterium]|nr:adenylate/guanylate cyclase domain-containing protein [Bdellovibrionota bacterium]
WTTEDGIQPVFHPGYRPNEEKLKENEAALERFAFSRGTLPSGIPFSQTPLVVFETLIGNLPNYAAVAEHQGFFNALPDPDGVIRRTALFMLAGRKPVPSLPLEMARVGLKEDLAVEFNHKGHVSSVSLAKSGRQLPVTPLGAVEFNFRGPGRTFTYVSAHDFFQPPGKPTRMPASERASALKDAYVLIGLSALGVHDMRNFPFDSNVPGVEGHATMLDNILNGDILIPSSNTNAVAWILAFMLAGALAFGWAMQKLESVPALLTFVGFILIFGFVDFHLLFARQNVNWETSFLYLEFALLFIVTFVMKYMEEETNKKFIRSAFSKYVAPAIVDSIMKDPTKLSLGGERRELTILFSDIRGFTTFSEAMDAKKLSQFLNDYLGIMTKLVFANEGTLDKYIGDAVMAFWGAPLDQPHHAFNACKTAMAMMHALGENRERWRQKYGVDVQIGIGLNSGHVSVGNMGSDDNFEYTVIGDHVNLASRLEGLTKAYGAGIVTSRFTFDCIKAAGLEVPRHRVLDFVKVKGKKTAVELIQVLERDMPDEGLRLWDTAIELYRAQKWDEAIDKFLAASAKLSAQADELDGPCEIFIERCQEFQKSPPPANWDGSWEMTSK